MKISRYPDRAEWPALLARPEPDAAADPAAVRTIVQRVRAEGDAALREFTRRFDKCELDRLEVSAEEMAQAAELVAPGLKDAIKAAAANIEKFHRAQCIVEPVVETTPGVLCWRRSVPIDAVGLYIPAGTAPLFSTVLMLGIPARLAGCGKVLICTPPAPDGRVAPETLYAASVCGIEKIYKAGGAQAIAAMAYGTETIPRVSKIFGPGNQFVAVAKEIVAADGVAIDVTAGPSEAAIIADDTCVPEFVAADLLSQAEHGPDSHVVLVTTSGQALTATLDEIDRQIARLPRAEAARKALANSVAILVADLGQAIEMMDLYAPEHLIIASGDAMAVAERVRNAGSVFIGNFSTESAGDYASGTNHTLPTGGQARAFSGVSMDSFVKKITFQKLSAAGLTNLGPAIEVMAAAEGLEGHRRAVSIRLDAIANGKVREAAK